MFRPANKHQPERLETSVSPQVDADQYDHEFCRVDFVIMSTLNRNAGGRETWAFTFIPQLLERYPNLHLTVYQMGIEKSAKGPQELLASVPLNARARLTITTLQVRRSRVPLFLATIFAFRSYFREASIPGPQYVLGAGSVHELLLILSCARYRQCRKVIWLRTILSHEKARKIPAILRPAVRRLEAVFLRKADILVANGDDIAAYYSQYGLNVSVIKNGVDLQRWSMPAPALKLPLKVGFIGRLNKVKGIEDFLVIAERVTQSGDQDTFEFHVVGDGGNLPAVHALTTRGVLTYHGQIENDKLPSVVEQLDICVALTYASASGGGGGTSNALLEQMAAGRVILAWNNQIFRQLLNDDNAYLANQGDVQGLFRCLNEIAADRSAAALKAKRATESLGEYTFVSQMNKYHSIHSRCTD
jgi:glycosyltransferase involved in cell wall biosynthesis